MDIENNAIAVKEAVLVREGGHVLVDGLLQPVRNAHDAHTHTHTHTRTHAHAHTHIHTHTHTLTHTHTHTHYTHTYLNSCTQWPCAG